MLELPDVTLVAIFTVEHALSRAAVWDCTSRVRFGDVKSFTDQKTFTDEIQIDKFSDLDEAGRFTTYEVPKYVSTSHALFIHWDSWVVNPGAWQRSFLDYDYVGAPWWYRDAYNVGNSGFCLRSKKLIDFLAANEHEFPVGSPEDHVLCRHYQPRLPQFRWAPEDLAYRFSVERTGRYQRDHVFGFHGMFNWPHVMSQDQIAGRLALATDYARGRSEYREFCQTMLEKYGERACA